MKQRKPAVWVSGAMVVGALLAGAAPSSAYEPGAPVLAGGTGGPYCGPCQPTPLVTRAAPGETVVALRYRWSVEARSFELVSEEKVGVTDEQGELRFTLPQGENSLDKVVVSTGGAVSEPFFFVTIAGCAGPRLCPLPRRFHAFANSPTYLTRQPIVVTVTGYEPGRVLDVALEEFAGDGETWLPAGEPVAAVVDALGHATVALRAPGAGAFRAVARDRESGEESGFALLEVNRPPAKMEPWFSSVSY